MLSFFYYALLAVHIICLVGAMAMALVGIIKGGRARGIWHAAAGSLVSGLGLVAVLEFGDSDVNHTKIGIKLAITVAIVALGILVQRRENAGATAVPAPAVPEAENAPKLGTKNSIPVRAPVQSTRPLLIAVIVLVVANVLLAVLW